jgi:hypothetical protein
MQIMEIVFNLNLPIKSMALPASISIKPDIVDTNEKTIFLKSG